jgi:hypothetical protein
MPTRKITNNEAPSVTTYLSDKPLSGHRLVVIESNGRIDYASRLSPTHPGRIIGLSLNAASMNDNVQVQRAGRVVEPSWSWKVSKPLWLDIDGQLTQVRPTNGFILVVGVAIALDTILMANIASSPITYLHG